MRRAANRVRVIGQLIDAPTGAHIWADRFDGPFDDIFDLQDKVTASVVGAIEPKLRLAEIERARRKPTEDLRAYDLSAAGACSLQYPQPRGHRRSHSPAGACDRLDPDFALAYAQAARCLLFWSFRDGPLSRMYCSADAVRVARVAIERGRDDPEVLATAAGAIGRNSGDLDAAIAIVSKAITLNPNSAYGFLISGTLHAGRGEPEIALDHLERAGRLSPMDIAAGLRLSAVALAHFVAGRYDIALDWTARALNETPNFLPPRRLRAACLGHLGRLEEGRQAVTQLLALGPNETVEQVQISMDTGSGIRSTSRRCLKACAGPGFRTDGIHPA